jgi:hypothetical protein
LPLIDQILSRPEFQAQPPLLVDIGASGGLPAVWKPIARYSICLAFDPDSREMGFSEKPSAFLKQIVVPKALTEKKATALGFYLTQSPYCSSLLKPRPDKLKEWAFAPLFEVVGKGRFKTARLPDLLRSLKLGPIDWFKTDSQGTDLRLFKSLSPRHQARMLVAEFEPGILDAYQGEDKLWQLMQHMENLPFWASAMEVRGSQRVPAALAQGLGRLPVEALPAAAGWAEIHYMNDFDARGLGLREHLLGWVFATLKHQHGFALKLALQGRGRFEDPLFESLSRASRASVRRRFWTHLPRMVALKLRNRVRAWA